MSQRQRSGFRERHFQIATVPEQPGRLVTFSGVARILVRGSLHYTPSPPSPSSVFPSHSLPSIPSNPILSFAFPLLPSGV
jgi:hypothetical protein